MQKCTPRDEIYLYWLIQLYIHIVVMYNIQYTWFTQKDSGKLESKSHRVNRNDLLVGWILTDYFHSFLYSLSQMFDHECLLILESEKKKGKHKNLQYLHTYQS